MSHIEAVSRAVPGVGAVARAPLDPAQRTAATGRLLGCEFTERSPRFGLERSHRAQARPAQDRRRRIELVEAVGTVRPRT